MKSTFTLVAILALAILLINGCSDDDNPTGSSGGAPVANFTMSVVLPEDALCLYGYDFVVDASSSTDDKTPTNDLEVRWDLDNDGEWDTDFGSMETNNDHLPDPAVDAVWIARCQVRDLDGNVSEKIDSIAIGPFPTSPDLIAGTICFSVDPFGMDDCVDTVQAGQGFSMMVYSTTYGDFMDPGYSTKVYRDGTLINSSSGGGIGGLFGCGGFGQGSSVINTPGSYVFTAEFDCDDDYAETDETNNTASVTLIVVP